MDKKRQRKTTRGIFSPSVVSLCLIFHTGTTRRAPVPVKYSSLHFDTSAINRRPCASVRCASRSSLFSAFLRKAPMRHETYWLTFAFLIYLPSDIITL